jgi:FkbM family methyltransferase
MIQQHEIFSKFRNFVGEAPGGYDRDFIGTKTRQTFWPAVRRDEPIHVQAPYPAFDEEYFEWVDLLESVANARDSYTMIELGAGFGRWAVRAGLAAQQYGLAPVRLVAVEAEPVHFEWLRQHFADNGLDPDLHKLIHAAVSDVNGKTAFYVGGPNGNDAPDQWYGQALASGEGKGESVDRYHGFDLRKHQNGWKTISVAKLSLSGILADIRQVDLIDLDVQGEELKAIESAIKLLDARAKRLHIGTHGPDIEAGLRKLLHSRGWNCVADYGSGQSCETPWGTIAFQDGVQSWINPRLK